MPLSWDRIEDRVLVGLEVIQEMEEQMQLIRHRGLKKHKFGIRVMLMRIALTTVMKLAT
jgi:hypothetical protein